jgi:multicomponent K+:H+ antiporter subunit A
MLVLEIGLLVVLYARYYMSPDDPVPRFLNRPGISGDKMI